MNSRLRKLFKFFFSDNGIPDFAELKKELDKPENHEALEELSLMRDLFSGDPEMNKEKIWAEISRHRGAGRLRRIVSKAIGYAAILIIPLLIAGTFLYRGILTPKTMEIADLLQIEPGKKQALIWIEDESYVDITNIIRDTVIQQQGYMIKLTAEGDISYVSDSVGNADIREITNTVLIPRGGEHSLILPDGSRVWLNSDSELRFNLPFTGAQRKVIMKGEAYFEVAHDPDRQFIVETADITLKVLGTRFNVKSYSGEYSLATLIEGSVGINYGDNGYVELRPNEQLVYHNGKAEVNNVDVRMFTAWMEGRFYFDSTSLDEISRQMERWYDIKFVFMDDTLRNERFTGVIKRESSANTVMETLQKIIGMQYDIKDRTVYVFRK